MTIRNRQLQELLEQYPDDVLIWIGTNESQCAICNVLVKYYNSDNYIKPDIIIECE